MNKLELNVREVDALIIMMKSKMQDLEKIKSIAAKELFFKSQSASAEKLSEMLKLSQGNLNLMILIFHKTIAFLRLLRQELIVADKNAAFKIGR